MSCDVLSPPRSNSRLTAAESSASPEVGMTLKKGHGTCACRIRYPKSRTGKFKRTELVRPSAGGFRSRYREIAEADQSSMFSNTRNLLKHNAFAFASGFLVIGLVAVVWGVFAWLSAPDFSSNGRVVKGTITHAWIKEIRSSASSDRHFQHLVTYNFTLSSGSIIVGEGEVTKEVFDGLKLGDQINVEVLLENPTVNRPVDPPDPYGGTIIFIFAGLFFAGFGAYLVKSSYRAASTLVGLHSHGIATKARVQELRRTQIRQGRSAIKIGGQPGEGDPFLYQLIYKYEGPDGQTYSGESQPYSAAFFAGANPQKDDIIDIIVDPDTPANSAWCQDFYGFGDKN